jgi:hypothetical protein
MSFCSPRAAAWVAKLMPILAAPCWASISSTAQVHQCVIFIRFWLRHVRRLLWLVNVVAFAHIKSYRLRYLVPMTTYVVYGNQMWCDWDNVYAGQTPLLLLIKS